MVSEANWQGPTSHDGLSYQAFAVVLLHAALGGQYTEVGVVGVVQSIAEVAEGNTDCASGKPILKGSSGWIGLLGMNRFEYVRSAVSLIPICSAADLAYVEWCL